MTFYSSLVTLPLQEAVVINYTAPLVAAALAWRCLGETFGRTDAVGTAVSFVGVLLLAHTHQPAASEGLLDVQVRHMFDEDRTTYVAPYPYCLW